MKSTRLCVALAMLMAMAGLAYVGQQSEPAGAKLVVAAQRFLDGLDADQKSRTLFKFDSEERTKWHFVPLQDNKTRKYTRKGLPLEEMTAAQKKLALALVAAGTSAAGNEQAVTIMSLESILREQEKKGAMVRNPEWYFFTIFGSPSKTGSWGWRVEGHHLSLNFTLKGTEVVAATPAFYGANPATVRDGPKKGHRTLGAAEDLAWDLFRSLDDEQKTVAYSKERFPEVRPTLTPQVGAAKGLPAGKMKDAQRATLMKLLRAYTERMPADVAEAEWKHVNAAGLDNIHFAFQGGLKAGEPHTYRVQGPSFVIEFLNEQNDSGGNKANHIHSVWRRIKGDFGL